MILHKEQFRHWGRLLVTFLVGQGASQIIRLISGFALIRWLAKEDYATFTLVLAIQGTAAVLVELGFSGGLIALIGNQYQQPTVVGRYIAAVQYYRKKLLLAGGIVLLVTFYFLAQRYEWSLWMATVLWVSVIIALIYQAQASFYKPILELHQKVKEIYTVDVGGSLIRLLLLGLASFFQLLSTPVALLIGTVQAWVAANAIKCQAKGYIQMPSKRTGIDVEKRELLDLTLPKVVGAIFFAFQGQVTIFLVGIFGQYNQMADLGALHKIGMLLMIPSAFSGVLIVPWFAKLAHGRVLKSYLGIVAIYINFGVALALFTWLQPQVFLWILGDGYQHLQWELFLYSISSSLALISGLTYALTSCRKWVYYWTGPTSIMTYVGFMIYFLLFIDLSSISNLITLSILNALTLVVLYQLAFFIGYRRDAAKAKKV